MWDKLCRWKHPRAPTIRALFDEGYESGADLPSRDEGRVVHNVPPPGGQKRMKRRKAGMRRWGRRRWGGFSIPPPPLLLFSFLFHFLSVPFPLSLFLLSALVCLCLLSLSFVCLLSLSFVFVFCLCLLSFVLFLLFSLCASFSFSFSGTNGESRRQCSPILTAGRHVASRKIVGRGQDSGHAKRKNKLPP